MTTTLPILSEAQTAMVAEFQCPGCPFGMNPAECDAFKPDSDDCGFRCAAHRAGTFASGGVGQFFLGLPKGFCRVVYPGGFGPKDPHKVVLHLSRETFTADKFNVPVWALERDGYLFLRVFMPRVDQTRVNIIKGGLVSMFPQAIDVAEFIDEMD